MKVYILILTTLFAIATVTSGNDDRCGEMAVNSCSHQKTASKCIASYEDDFPLTNACQWNDSSKSCRKSRSKCSVDDDRCGEMAVNSCSHQTTASKCMASYEDDFPLANACQWNDSSKSCSKARSTCSTPSNGDRCGDLAVNSCSHQTTASKCIASYEDESPNYICKWNDSSKSCRKARSTCSTPDNGDRCGHLAVNSCSHQKTASKCIASYEDELPNYTCMWNDSSKRCRKSNTRCQPS